VRLAPAPQGHPMAPAIGTNYVPVLAPTYHRTLATALHLDALTLVTRLQLLEICWAAMRLACAGVSLWPAARSGGRAAGAQQGAAVQAAARR